MVEKGTSDHKELDDRFSDYVNLYISLDRLIWSVPSILIGATVIGVGIITTKNGELLTEHNGFSWILFFILGIINALGAISIARLRQHHTLVGHWLSKMEDYGYFHKRKETISRWWFSAPNWFLVAFIIFSIASFYFGTVLLLNEEYNEMKVTTEIEKYGIKFNSEKMENGELRFRLNASDGSAYIRTEAGKSGAWQNSHYHKSLEETYIVQKGWMAVGELINGSMSLRIEEENNSFTSQPEVAHNIYLPEGAIIHTVKHGKVEPDDWHSSPELDTLTKILTEEDIRKYGKNKI